MSLEFKNIILANYKIIKILGKGTFSTVKLAIDRETGEKIAIKILEKNKIKSKRDFKRIERELNMVRNINHPNIAKVYDIKEDEDKYYIMMEYCENGELFNLILAKRRLNEEESAYFYYQIINGLEYIHINNIIHRDLKPENLLLTKKNILKIIDFGLSNYNTYDNLLSTPCGSPCYASPEMVSGKKYNGFTSDVWSTGIILYAMIYGYLPFENINHNNNLLFKKIAECKVDYPRNSCLFALDLLKKILVPNPNERYKISDIKQHKFYLKGKAIFNHKHKDLNIYQIFEKRKDNKYDNNRKFSREKKISINNYYCETYNNKENKKLDSEYLYYADNLNENYNGKNVDSIQLITNKDNIYKYKNKKKNSCQNTLGENIYDISNKKILKSFPKNPYEEKRQTMTEIGTNYFSNLNNNENKRNTYSINLSNNNTETKNNLNTHINNIKRKNNISIGSSIKIDNIKNSDIYKLEEEQKISSKIFKKNKDIEQNVRLTNFMQNQYNSGNKERNKIIQIENVLEDQIKTSESKIHKKIDIDKFPNLNSSDLKVNNYTYDDLSNIKKISPPNLHNKKNILINLKNENITKNKENGDIMIIIKNENFNVNNYINKTENNFNKKNNNKIKIYQGKNKEENINEKRGIKKYSFSVQKNNNIENKCKNLLNGKTAQNSENFEKLIEIEENNDFKKDSFDERDRKKSNKIKNNDNLISNSRIKVSKHVSQINYLPNSNKILMNNLSPDKTKLSFDKTKNKIYRKKNDKNNLSFNKEFIPNEKNFSFLNNNQALSTLYNQNEKYIIKESNNHLTRNTYEIRSDFNRNIIFSSNYLINHINNKSLVNNNTKNKNKSKEDKERNNYNYSDNYEKISEINKKRTNLKEKDTRNNYISKISNNKRGIDYKKLQKKSTNNSVLHELKENSNSLSFNNEELLKYQRIRHSQNKEIKSREKEEDKYYKDKTENLRLILNKMDNNKLSDEYFTKINYSNKEIKSKNYNNEYYTKYQLTERRDNYFDTERNDKINSNNKQYSYVQMSFNNNKNLSNKSLKDKHEINNYKIKNLNRDKKIEEDNNNNSYEKKKSIDKLNKWNINTNTIINNINKININNLPSITIDMNILNKNNKKYLKYYDSIKSKL